MNSHTVLFIAAAQALTRPIPLRAQGSPLVSPSSVIRPSTAISADTYTASTLVMIENRARALGARTSASGTRYFAVTDADVAGKKPDEILRRLAPAPVTALDGVRKMEVLVDLQRPITIYSNPGQPVNIGTAVVQAPGLQNINVHASIFANQVKVVTK